MRIQGGRPARLSLLPFLLFSLIGLAAALAWRTLNSPPISRSPESNLAANSAGMEASREQVEQTCGSCHSKYPTTGALPETWLAARGRSRIQNSSRRAARSRLIHRRSPAWSRFFSACRTRRSLPVLERTIHAPRFPGAMQFELKGYRTSRGLESPGIANVRFVHFSDEQKLDVFSVRYGERKGFAAETVQARGERPYHQGRCYTKDQLYQTNQRPQVATTEHSIAKRKTRCG